MSAWILSYILTIELGQSAPKWLVAVIGVFAATYSVVTVISLMHDYQQAQRSALRELERDARVLAKDLRRVLDEVHAGIETQIGPNGGYTYTAADVAKARERTSELVVTHYEHRFAAEARYLAIGFRRHPVPQTDVFFRVVADGPKDDGDVLQIAGGLERLARQLREGVNDAG